MTTRRRHLPPLAPRAVLIALAGAALAGAGSTRVPAWPRIAADQIARPALVDLESAAALRQQFNDDRGNIRLVLLLSPT